MTYSIKRLREEGHFCLSNLEDVESLDALWEEANKVERLYIEDTGVFVAPTNIRNFEGEFVGLRCRLDGDYKTCLAFVGKKDDIARLRSVAFRVLCLPKTSPHSVAIDGSSSTPRNPRDKLILTPEQLRHVICAYPSRSYSFSYWSLTPEQSVELVSHRKFRSNLYDCKFEDKGQAIVDWLENRNETEIMDSFYAPFCDFHEKFLTFLSRSKYPVFDRLFLDGRDVAPRLSRLIGQASVKIVDIDIAFFAYSDDWRAPVLQALRDGTFRPENLELDLLCAPIYGNFDKKERVLVGKFLCNLLTAISSPKCSLKELHLKNFNLKSITTDFKKNLREMLLKNRSLRVFGIYSTMAPLAFPQMDILKAAAKHPRLRRLCFFPPKSTNPPRLGQFDPFLAWVQKNRSHDIQFKDFRDPDLKPQRVKWQHAVFSFFTKEYDAIQHVEDERTRSHLLVTGLSSCHLSPDRIYYLLFRNQDVFAR